MKRRKNGYKNPEMTALEEKFPRMGVSSPETTPKHNHLELEEAKPLDMEIEKGVKVITDDSLGKIF